METIFAKNHKKGISLVEVVVAMAVVTIISVSAYSVCNYSLLQQRKIARDTFFVNEANNIVNCLGVGSDEFVDAIKLLTNKDVAYNEDFELFYDSHFEYVDTFDESTYYLSFDFLDNGWSINIFKSKGNELLLSRNSTN